jgi:uncharacterized phage protein gp47/JayE
MPFQRPTLQELIGRAQSDIEARLPGSQPRLPHTLLGILARQHAEAVSGLYGNQVWIARQILPDTSDEDILLRQASLWGVTPLAATPAKGDVTFSGTDAAVIPAGTSLQAADETAYTTDAEATIAAGTAVVAVTAVEGGAAGNQAAGVALSLVSPISGVTTEAIVAAAGLTGGADPEDVEALRARVLLRLRKPPHGGSLDDYVTWALEAHPDVTNVWPAGGPFLGEVTVHFTTYGATVDGIPVQTVIDAVQAHIDAQRPVTADAFVVAPIADPLDFVFSSVTPNTQAVQDAIDTELRDLLRREAEPGDTLEISRIREAISRAEGEEDYVLDSPSANVVSAAGNIATMGVITWP